MPNKDINSKKDGDGDTGADESNCLEFDRSSEPEPEPELARFDYLTSVPPILPPLPPAIAVANILSSSSGSLVKNKVKSNTIAGAAASPTHHDNPPPQDQLENAPSQDEEAVLETAQDMQSASEVFEGNHTSTSMAIASADYDNHAPPTTSGSSHHNSDSAGPKRISDQTIIVPEAYLVEANSFVHDNSTTPSIYQAMILRPWYTQKRFLFPLLIVVSAVIIMGIFLGKKSKGQPPPPTESIQSACKAKVRDCGPTLPCPTGMCCSQLGFCGTTKDFCGECCQGDSCWDSRPQISKPIYTADNDSRLMAFVGNWETCPTVEQIRPYSHLIIAFAVTYTWTPAQNVCDQKCNIANITICENKNRQDLVDMWRDQGKKVILSFGGSGMGSSRENQNNCWDYCFGKEEELAKGLVDIVNAQRFDGVNIDYDYCYDVNNTQHRLCLRRSNLYSDQKAQFFLDNVISKLRTKLDALQSSSNRTRYELSHTPQDHSLSPTSRYFKILQDKRADLDYLMPKFYNGLTLVGDHGLFGGQNSAGEIYTSFVNDVFKGKAHKVVMGFCISECHSSLTNINASAAVQTLADLKAHNNGQFACNGGSCKLFQVSSVYHEHWCKLITLILWIFYLYF